MKSNELDEKLKQMKMEAASELHNSTGADKHSEFGAPEYMFDTEEGNVLHFISDNKWELL